MADHGATSPPLCPPCPLCRQAPEANGPCPDCGQDLAPLANLAQRGPILYNRGLALAAGGDDEAAVRHLDAALTEDPTLVDAWVVLGKLRARLGDVRAARHALAEVVRLEPGHSGAVAALAALDGRAAAPAQATRRRRWAVLGAAAVLLALAATLPVVLLRPASPPTLPGLIGIAGHDGTVELTGLVPDDPARTAYLGAARGAAGVRNVVDALVVNPAVGGPNLGVDAVGGLAGAVVGGDGWRDVRVSLDRVGRGQVVVSGTVADEQAHRVLLGALGAAAPGAAVEDRLAVGLAGDETAHLAAAVTAVQAAGPIGFPAGEATLDAQARATVAAVAGLLGDAPGIRVEVDGYAAKTPGSAEEAQALSQRRAAAVGAALRAAGVDPALVTVRGLGDAGPQAGRTATITVGPA